MKCRHGLDLHELGPGDSGYPCSCCGRVEIDPLCSGFLCPTCFRIDHGLAGPAWTPRTVRVAPTLESLVAELAAVAPECQGSSASRWAIALAQEAVELCKEAREARDGYRNGQEQMQDAFTALWESYEAGLAECRQLAAERDAAAAKQREAEARAAAAETYAADIYEIASEAGYQPADGPDLVTFIKRAIVAGRERAAPTQERGAALAGVAAEREHGVAAEPKLLDISASPRDGFQFSIEDPTGAVRLLAQCFSRVLQEQSAPNYVEMLMRSSDDRSGVIVTLQREAGKTPHQIRAAAEASAAALRAEMQRLVQQLRAGADKWIAYTKKTDIEEDARARAYAYAESDRQSARMIDDVLYATSVDRACDSSAATAENKTDAG